MKESTNQFLTNVSLGVFLGVLIMFLIFIFIPSFIVEEPHLNNLTIDCQRGFYYNGTPVQTLGGSIDCWISDSDSGYTNLLFTLYEGETDLYINGVEYEMEDEK